MWNLPPPSGFQGLRDDLPLEVYERHMPHWRQEGATYFVTFRLADSLPQARLRELAALKSEWERLHPEPRPRQALESLARMVSERIEGWLDEGYGSCVLSEPEMADHIATAMHHFDGERYELACYVVMPNHVHSVMRPTQPREHPLETLLKSWKSYSGRRINESLRHSGSLWQEESYDRIVRDEEHLWRTVQYVGRNPRNAGLSPERCRLWVRPQWEALGWKFCE
jgi:REP element-mobilizing transposase RayT